MNKKIKLLIFAKSIDGGTGTFLENVSKIRSGKITVEKIILEKPEYRKPKQEKEYIFLRPRHFYPQKYSVSPVSIFNFIKELFWYHSYIKKLDPDLVLSVDSHCNLISSFDKYLFPNSTKLILTTHINLKDTIRQKSSHLLNILLTASVKYFYNKADLLVCISKEQAKQMRRDFHIKKPVITIYYGITLKKQLRFQDNFAKKIVVSAGRLVEQKDYFTLINAFSIAKDKIFPLKLWIIGEGPLKHTLEKHVKKFGMSKDILFLGWKQNVISYVKQSSAFVLSSKREGFGYVLIEAMSQGIPVIATNAPFGPSEIIGRNQYGLLVPVKDKYLLAEAMVKLLKNKRLYDRYREKSLERAAFFSNQKMIAAYRKVVYNVLKPT